MARFEKISKYKDIDIPLPRRATSASAGYDFIVAEDTIIPPYKLLYETLQNRIPKISATLSEIAEYTKFTKTRPTLVPTGIKCYLDKNQYLELSVRSSTPLKHWLVLANSVGR